MVRESEMEYKKTYKLFILWILGVCIFPFCIAFTGWNAVTLTRIMYLFGAAAVAGLAYIIYRTGYVYWYNGISYEKALEAGEERRKQYALKHVCAFCKFTFAYLLYSVLAGFLHWSIWIDTPVFLIGIITTALWTSKYML